MKIKILAGAAALVLMSACASEAPAPPPPQAYRPPPPPPPPADQCGAAEAQKYVGRPRSEIPIPVLPSLQRVACTTCPVTQDFSPRRLNFYYDAQTGIVQQVKCG
ncbi:peptidase inhibitor I78 [Phenylobacterium sp.]|uniref:peptidase inhibitor I78 n=1 Tax=Phenylobacterium sp. TaxID=1871053 RepID=UPI00286E1DA3|nr:peptidase inhibitor I78 [Phenylobacterium sp.]